jgi:hypothetical protein
VDKHDGMPLALGLRFYTAVAGDITAIRFYKAQGEAGSGHVGMIYNWATGQRLASTDRETEDWDCEGPRWVSLPLRSPLRISPSIEYVVALDSAVRYSKSFQHLMEGRESERGTIFTVPGGAVFGVQLGTIPRQTYRFGDNYWVDGEWHDVPRIRSLSLHYINTYIMSYTYIYYIICHNIYTYIILHIQLLTCLVSLTVEFVPRGSRRGRRQLKKKLISRTARFNEQDN